MVTGAPRCSGRSEVESGHFDPTPLEPVAERGDELGELGRVFRQMAQEVHQREERLKRRVADLAIEIDESRKRHHQV